MAKVTFDYHEPKRMVLTKALVHETLKRVRDELLSHRINGGAQKLSMDCVIDTEFYTRGQRKAGSCGMAACIGGWTSIFLLGYEKDGKKEGVDSTVSRLFDHLVATCDPRNSYGGHSGGKLHQLFYDYGATVDYDEPNVAATAIQRYLDGKRPWPQGDMPNVLPYTKTAKRK